MTRNFKSNEVIEGLIKGYNDFHGKYFNQDQVSLYQKLVTQGQAPKTMIIACSDSRVDPSIILNAAPGEIFMVRNVANLVPPCENDAKHHGTSAALQFAVCFLQVEHVIVFGHSHCGGIRALLSDTPKSESTQADEFISSWMEIAEEAKAKTLALQVPVAVQEQHCCEYSLMASLDNLYTFSWIRSRVEAGTLALHAWHFDLETGKIRSFDPESKAFKELVFNRG